MFKESDEILDWKKNAKLDPIPLHRLKKVATAEVFRVNYVHPTFLPNVESEDNWVDKIDWSDAESGDDDKQNIVKKSRRNYSRNYKRAAEIKQIRDSIPDENLRKKLDDILSDK